MIDAHPLVYEINTRAWLRELSLHSGGRVTLADVPQSEIDSWRGHGFTHIWLMGVWMTGPRSREVSLRHLLKAPGGDTRPTTLAAAPGEDTRPTRPEEVLGSPYAVSEYQVSPLLGGTSALKQFRARLAVAGLKLILDFVPNHTGLDHPWLVQRPDLFVRTPARKQGSFLQQTRLGPRWIAHGRDPYFDPWLDTAQLDYRNPETREAMLAQLQAIAPLCDGVRCDMAMLVLNDVFEKTWSAKSGQTEVPEFWTEAIPAVKKVFPEFLFLAEVYWGLEARLQKMGFDYAYEKIFYDLIVASRTQELHRHLLQASSEFLRSSAHFLENHDEPRIASILSPPKHRAAALLLLGLPGLRLLHEGQLVGAKKRASVHLWSRPHEAVDLEVREIYERLLKILPESLVAHGHAKVLETTPAWAGNPTAENFVVIQWEGDRAFDLVVVNLASHQSQCYVRLEIFGIEAHRWRMKNLLGPENYERDGRELRERGLYLDAPGYAAQLFRFRSM